MTIDSHQHFWIFDPVRDAWINDNMSILRNHFLPSDVAPILKSNAVDACIAVQADQSLQETHFLLKLAHEHEFIKGVVGWADLQAEDIENQLDNLQSAEKLVGFRHIIQAEKDPDFMQRTTFRRGIEAIGKRNYSYDILIYPNQLKNTLELVKTFPHQIFILDHLAKPYIKQGLIDEWQRDIKTLAQLPNIFCKVSGIITEADWQKWTYPQIKPYLEVIFESFGVDRLLFGSDYPVCLLAGSYKNVKSILDTYLQDFSTTEKQKVMGLNAAKVYQVI